MSIRGEPGELTPTVEHTAQQVMQQVGASTQQLVIVEGLSGTGKSALLEHIAPQINALGGIILTRETFEPEKINQDEIEGPVVASTTVTRDYGHKDASREIERLFPDREAKTIILPGMDSQETEAFVAKLPQGSLSSELVAYYSMGVPLLARRFVQADSEDQLTTRTTEYIRQATRYNGEDLTWLASTYLQMPIPTEALPGMSAYGVERIYSRLEEAEQERASLAKQGVIEESPLFVAPESERIYNAMLQSEQGSSDIDIFIPGMSQADFDRLQQALGYDEFATHYDEQGEHMGDYDQRKSTRAKMFAADFRKSSYWFRDPSGLEHAVDNEYSAGAMPIPVAVEKYQTALNEGRLGLPASVTDDGNPSMWIHSHEHYGMASHTARFGWMVESLLQQRGIAYFVNNETCYASYAYLPDEKRIEILPERVKMSRWGG